MARASVTHQVIISPATAKTRAAGSLTPKGFTKYRIPAIPNPASRERCLVCCFDKQVYFAEKYNLFGFTAYKRISFDIKTIRQ